MQSLKKGNETNASWAPVEPPTPNTDQEDARPSLYRWSSSHTIAVDSDWVQEFNKKPLVPFFISREGTEARKTHFEHVCLLDLSPFLAGRTSVSQTFGASDRATEWEGHAASVLTAFAAESAGPGAAAPPPAAAAPPPAAGGETPEAGVSPRENASVHSEASAGASQVSQRSGSVTGAATASAAAAKAKAKVMDPEDFRAVALHDPPGAVYPVPKGISYLRVTVFLSKGEPMLPDMDELNPVTITITSARNLPGVRVEALRLKHYVAESPFALQKEYSKPT